MPVKTFVPGATVITRHPLSPAISGIRARKRIDRWLARGLSGTFSFADERGRDAFAFDPIESAHLTAADDLKIVTPYSRTIISGLRAVPWAWWNSDDKAWHVPYRSLEELRKHWPVIEAAARRNIPDERRKRCEQHAGTEGGKAVVTMIASGAGVAILCPPTRHRHSGGC
jgi:hypothetical protein